MTDQITTDEGRIKNGHDFWLEFRDQWDQTKSTSCNNNEYIAIVGCLIV